MNDQKAGFRSIDDYIATFPDAIQALLETLRATIRAAAPDAEERISYQMPAFALNGNLVYFAALKNHIGLYPTASGIAAFQRELSGYESTKGAVRFPLSQPLPLELVSEIVKFRAAENRAKAAAKEHAKEHKSKA
ncbi:MAG: iron chaperone [Ktedonobacterales bacterium]